MTMLDTIRYWRQRHVMPRVMAAALIAAAGLWTGGYLLASKSSQNANKSTDSCTAALSVRDAIEDVLTDAKRRTEDAPARTPREHQQATQFYTKSIRRLRAVQC